MTDYTAFEDILELNTPRLRPVGLGVFIEYPPHSKRLGKNAALEIGHLARLAPPNAVVAMVVLHIDAAMDTSGR